MRQSVFTRISKQLGWEILTEVPIPSIHNAEELHEAVCSEKSRDAFTEVFRIHRFSANPDNNEEAEALSIIGQAFWQGSLIFKAVHDDED